MTTLASSTYLAAHDAALFLSGAVDEVPDPEDVRPGWIALGSFVLLALVTVLLWLSMRKQLRRIDFGEDEAAGEPVARDDTQAATGDPDATESEEPVENGDQRGG